MYERIARALIPLGFMLGLFCFIMGAYEAPGNVGKAICIVAAIGLGTELLRFEIKN